MTHQILISIPIEEYWIKVEEIIKKVIVENKVKIPAEIKPDFLTQEEVAQLLKVSKVTMIKYTRNGNLKGYRIGRCVQYKRNEIDKTLKGIKVFRFR